MTSDVGDVWRPLRPFPVGLFFLDSRTCWRPARLEPAVFDVAVLLTWSLLPRSSTVRVSSCSWSVDLSSSDVTDLTDNIFTYSRALYAAVTAEKYYQFKVTSFSNPQAEGLKKIKQWKQKLMFGCDKSGNVEEKGKWPCSVYRNGVCKTSILCITSPKWVSEWCSVWREVYTKHDSRLFVCKSRKASITDEENYNDNVDLDITRKGS